MDKFYRTYVFVFNTSTGIKVYAGKRTSRNKSPANDSYLGSGTVIKSAIRKYGNGCIISKFWQEHESEELMNEFEDLLIEECHEKYGNRCTNIAPGGRGGPSFDSDERARRSAKMKELYANSDEREKQSSRMKVIHQCPDIKRKHRDGIVHAKRTKSISFQTPLYWHLWEGYNTIRYDLNEVNVQVTAYQRTLLKLASWIPRLIVDI